MKTLILIFSAVSLMAVATACGGDGDDTPTTRPTPTPATEPVPQGDDDESQIRYTLDLWVYYIDQNEFELMCEQYSDDYLDNLPCGDIIAGLVGTATVAGDGTISARIPSIDEVTIDGDTATGIGTFCIDIGAGETCGGFTPSLVREGDRWKISG